MKYIPPMAFLHCSQSDKRFFSLLKQELIPVLLLQTEVGLQIATPLEDTANKQPPMHLLPMH